MPRNPSDSECRRLFDILLEIEGAGNRTYRNDVHDASRLTMVRDLAREAITIITGREFKYNPKYPEIPLAPTKFDYGNKGRNP